MRFLVLGQLSLRAFKIILQNLHLIFEPRNVLLCRLNLHLDDRIYVRLCIRIGGLRREVRVCALAGYQKDIAVTGTLDLDASAQQTNEPIFQSACAVCRLEPSLFHRRSFLELQLFHRF